MSNDITDLRNILFETMRDVKEGKTTIEQAKMVAELGQTIINTAKVEVDYLTKRGGGRPTGFLPDEVEPKRVPAGI